MKKEVEIRVMGQKFMVRSDSSEEYISTIASYVDQKMTEIGKSSKSVASLNIAILAAMNIADEFFKFKAEKDKKSSRAEKKIRDILELIDLQV